MAETRHCNQKTAMSWPCIGEAGKTGDWRTMRPVLNADKCIAAQKGKVVCMQCWVFCPDNTITRTAPPSFVLEYCKGCGICAVVCPTKAIEMLPEHEHEEMPVESELMEGVSCDG